MRNAEFWNDVLRKKIKEYIKNQSFFSRFIKDTREQMVEVFVEMLEAFKEDIFREADREYYREDVLSKINDLYGEKSSEFFSGLPIKIIDSVVDALLQEIEDSEQQHSEMYLLKGVLDEISFLGGLEKYSDEELQKYKEYLIDWFQCHDEGAPACIAEFFDWEGEEDDDKWQNS